MKDNPAIKHHVVITGTGRSGTTFLVALLSRLGLDTGKGLEVVQNCSHVGHGGLENRMINDMRDTKKPFPVLPYICKDPCFINYADEVLENPCIHIDHVFIPMRDLYSAAESRRQNTKKAQPNGGLWLTTVPSKQEEVLQKMMYELFLKLSSTHIPVSLIQYPMLVQNPEYLYKKLQPLLSQVPYEVFFESFSEVVVPTWSTDYTKTPNSSDGDGTC